MQTELKEKNIVFAGVFNVASYDKYFFIKNDIVKEEEILDNSVFAGFNGVTQLITNKIQITISLGQLIISDLLIGSSESNIENIAISIVEKLKNSSVVALGINLNWSLMDESRSLGQLSKDLFYNDKIELFSKMFNSDNPMYGVYASKNIKDGRVKLDIKPHVIKQPDNSTMSFLYFIFNFHFDIKNKEGNSELLTIIRDYSFYKEESVKILSIYCK